MEAEAIRGCEARLTPALLDLPRSIIITDYSISRSQIRLSSSYGRVGSDHEATCLSRDSEMLLRARLQPYRLASILGIFILLTITALHGLPQSLSPTGPDHDDNDAAGLPTTLHNGWDKDTKDANPDPSA